MRKEPENPERLGKSGIGTNRDQSGIDCCGNVRKTTIAEDEVERGEVEPLGSSRRVCPRKLQLQYEIDSLRD